MNTSKEILKKDAFETYQSLKSSPEVTYLVNKLKAFNEYLVRLCDQICQKGLKDKFIYQWIFTNQISKQRDFDSYCKANLFAANASLNRIIYKILQDGINQVSIRMLTDFICDLKPFVLQYDKNQDYSWLLTNTNSHISNFYYNISNNIFWNGEPGNHSQEKLVLASSSTFLIRQSIEYKIKRILGIDYIMIDGKPDIRTVERCFKAIHNNKNYYRIKDFDFSIVKRIHSWTNYYVHGGYRPEPWRIETAINYLKNLFYKGQSSNKSTLSYYAGIEVLEDEIIKVMDNTEKSIKNEVKGVVEIKWLSKPEVVIIRNQ